MISDCYDPAMSERVGGKPPSGVAFLLTQVGTHAARRFAERVAELDITPPVAGLLRSSPATGGVMSSSATRSAKRRAACVPTWVSRKATPDGGFPPTRSLMAGS